MSEKYTIEMTSGNFELKLTIEPKDEVIRDVIQKGLKSELERRVLTTTYLKLCGVPGKRAGKKVLPEGFKREELHYDTDSAAEMRKAIESEMGKVGMVSWINVSEWTPAVEDSKYVDERAAMLRHESVLNDLETWLPGKIGYHGPSHDENEEYHIDALIAVRRYVKELRKNI